MLQSPLKYWNQRLRKNKLDRLAMTILVKDEIDIIEENIRFHSQVGVDCFAIMDNNSTDGTREKLESLSLEFDISIIDQKNNNYQQARWMTQLAFHAKKQLGADLVINNDADEFWKPTGKSLKEHLSYKDSVVTVNRFNMALSKEFIDSENHFLNNSLVVINPIAYSRETQMANPATSMLLVKIGNKTIVNPHGLIKMKGGNHYARHGWRRINERFETGIQVFHYPIRNYQQFLKNIENRKLLLKNPEVIMGSHYKRWVSLLDQGKLREEFDRFTLTTTEIEVLSKIAVIEDKQVPPIVITD